MISSRALGALLLLAVTPVLAGCGLPDLVAHGVKAVEKRGRTEPAGDQAGSSSSAQPQARSEDEPPPPASTPAPRRSSVTVEELPAR